MFQVYTGVYYNDNWEKTDSLCMNVSGHSGVLYVRIRCTVENVEI